MELPENWSQVSLETYLEIRRISGEDFKGVTSLMVEVLSIVSGEDSEVIADMKVKEIKKLYDKVAFVQEQPRIRVCKEITVAGQKFRFKGMGLTLGEYIDLVGWNEGEIKADLMAAALYRKTKKGRWGETVWEPRDYDLRERADLFLDLPVSQVWGVVNEFREFNVMIREKYGDLFPEPETEEPEEAEAGVKRRTIGSQHNEAKERARKLHQWQKLVHDLCGGDITKRLEVLRTPVIYVFNIMGMNHDLKDE